MSRSSPRGHPEPPDPNPAAGTITAPTKRNMEEDICREILAIHRASYGETARRGEAHLMDDTVIVMHEGDDIALLPGEELLIECGRGDTVRRVRDKFQQTIEPTFKAAVERATGRRVVGFGSCTRLDEPRFSVEVFRLEPN